MWIRRGPGHAAPSGRPVRAVVASRVAAARPSVLVERGGTTRVSPEPPVGLHSAATFHRLGDIRRARRRQPSLRPIGPAGERVPPCEVATLDARQVQRHAGTGARPPASARVGARSRCRARVARPPAAPDLEDVVDRDRPAGQRPGDDGARPTCARIPGRSRGVADRSRMRAGPPVRPVSSPRVRRTRHPRPEIESQSTTGAPRRPDPAGLP